MYFTLNKKSVKTGEHFHFFNRGRYIYVSINDSKELQICKGGYTMGNTLMCASESDFYIECNRWYKACIAKSDPKF